MSYRIETAWPGGAVGRAALGSLSGSGRSESVAADGERGPGIVYGSCQGVRADGRAYVLLDGSSAVLALAVDAALPLALLVGRRVAVAGDDPVTWMVVGVFGSTLLNVAAGLLQLDANADVVAPHWVGVGAAPSYLVDVVGSGYGLRVKAAAQTDNAQMRLETSGAVGGSGGAAGIDLFDGTGRAGRLVAAMSNASGGRYFGFICEVDRDANNLPFQIFTRGASGGNTRALSVLPDPQQGYVIVGNTATANAVLHVYNAEVGVTTGILEMLRLQHSSSVATAAGFGTSQMWAGKSTTNANREMADVTVQWATATDASRKARLSLNVWDTVAREGLRLEASGTAALVGFYGAAAVAKQVVTGSRGGNAALASLLTALASLGLVTDSST